MKMNRKSIVFALVVAVGIAAIATTRVRAAADTQLLALMPPDSQILAGARIDQAVVSPVGQYILSKMGSNLDELKNKTGFDPRTDLREVVVSPIAKFAALRGTFPVSRWEDFMQQQSQTLQDYRGFSLVGSSTKAGVFLDGSTLVFGSPDAVRAAVDRWIARTPAPDNDLTAKIAEVSATSQAWFAATSLSALETQMGPNTPDVVKNVLQKISAVSGQVTLPNTGRASVQGQVQAASPEDAQTLVDAFNALKLLTPPQLANSPLLSPEISISGAAINGSLSLTEQRVEALLAGNPQP